MKAAMRIEVSDNIGSVSAEIVSPENPKAVLVLAHGAGAGMVHPFMKSLSEELTKFSIATLRFNFPFIEQKKSRPDFPTVAHATIEAAIQIATEEFSSVPLYAGGKSFGGRMTSQLMASKNISSVKGIVFFGFPLHQPGNPSIERAEHLIDVKVPMLFLQGTRDALAEISRVNQVVESIPNAKLIEFEGADHSFKSGKLNLIPALAEHTAKWIFK